MVDSRMPTDRGRILLGYSEPDGTFGIDAALTDNGYAVDSTCDRGAVLDALSRSGYEAVVLDMRLGNGAVQPLLESVRRLSNAPVIALVSGSDPTDRVTAFDRGASDVLPAPITAEELLCRLNRALCPGKPADFPTLIVRGNLTVDLGFGLVSIDDRAIDLTAREFELVAHLAASPGRIYTKNQLLRSVWNVDPQWQSPHTVVEHVHRLRRKLGPGPDGKPWIETVRRLGYRFRQPVG